MLNFYECIRRICLLFIMNHMQLISFYMLQVHLLRLYTLTILHYTLQTIPLQVIHISRNSSLLL
jgi:hypothetical protein